MNYWEFSQKEHVLDFSKYYGKERDKEALDNITKNIMENIIMLTNTKK